MPRAVVRESDSALHGAQGPAAALGLRSAWLPAGLPSLAGWAGRRVVLVSHDLRQTGSPLLLAETGARLQQAGAGVELVTLGGDAQCGELAARHGLALTPLDGSLERGAAADLVIANTAETSPWVDRYLAAHPDRAAALVWWIHELDARHYAPRMHALGRAALALFDSYASLRSWREAGVALPPALRVIHPCVEDRLLRIACGPAHALARAAPARLAERLPTERSRMRRQLGLAARDFALTLVGTHVAHKGYDLLLAAVAELRRARPELPVRLVLVGFASEPSKRDYLAALPEAERAALAERRAVSVVADPTPYYAASDAFVMNSQGLGENFGRVTIEAMAFGLPVLGTAAGGTPEIVEDGVTGLLHPLGRAGQPRLVEHIAALAADPSRARALGAAGQRRVRERFGAARFYTELGRALGSLRSAAP